MKHDEDMLQSSDPVYRDKLSGLERYANSQATTLKVSEGISDVDDDGEVMRENDVLTMTMCTYERYYLLQC